jgi:predicted CxxxxCH...CXXCH cytochrome family protein
MLGDYDTSGFAPELGGQGNLVISKIEGGHQAIALNADELNALADFADANAPAPAPVPQPVDGPAVYDNNCSGCHAVNGYDASGSPDLAGAGFLVADKLAAGHMGQSLSIEETTALADFLDQFQLPAPAPEPVPQPVDGPAVYDNNCSGCHAVNGYDAVGSPDLAGAGFLVDDKLAAGHMGQSLSAEETIALADFLDQFQAPVAGPDYSDCTACHGQPPTGNGFPNTDGAHLAHAALPGVGNNCSICHSDAAHNDQVDLGFPAAYDAKSGTAIDNMDGTCSSISCHGGQQTPDWWTGSLSVNTQCASCHTPGTTQYNSQNSGEHSRHRSYDCTVCHNSAKMSNHFGNLATPAFETSPAGTVGGGSTRVGSYSGGTCSSISCHGSESW